MQISQDEVSDEDDVPVTGHVVSPEEAAEMEEELRREEQSWQEGDESQKEDLPVQPPPTDARPREGKLGKIQLE